MMRFAFALGVGRSGTTLLGRLLACTPTPLRFVNELCPGIPERIPNPVFMVEPEDATTVEGVRDALRELASGKSPFAPAQARRIERDDPDARVLLLKDVHSLLAYPTIVSGLEPWRAVVITRSTSRALDSYFKGHARGRRRYLVEDYAYLAADLDGAPVGSPLRGAAGALSPRARAYLRRPRFLTREKLRQAVVSHALAGFLRSWAESDERVAHVRFEELCRDPLGEATRLFDFLGLDWDDATLETVRRMTSGSSNEYYATDKDSRAILDQPFEALSARDRRAVAHLLGAD